MAERFVRYSDTTDDLTSAWAAVMGWVDEFPRPTIAIRPISTLEEGTSEWVDRFEVEVSGVVAEPQDASHG